MIYDPAAKKVVPNKNYKEEAEVVQEKTRVALEQVADWNVPLLVTTRIGNNWQEVTK